MLPRTRRRDTVHFSVRLQDTFTHYNVQCSYTVTCYTPVPTVIYSATLIRWMSTNVTRTVLHSRPAFLSISTPFTLLPLHKPQLPPTRILLPRPTCPSSHHVFLCFHPLLPSSSLPDSLLRLYSCHLPSHSYQHMDACSFWSSSIFCTFFTTYRFLSFSSVLQVCASFVRYSWCS